MSFFGGLNNGGIRGPEVAINQAGGSLLPNSGSGLRFSSAQINQQSSLLSGIAPYSYGQGVTGLSHNPTTLLDNLYPLVSPKPVLNLNRYPFSSGRPGPCRQPSQGSEGCSSAPPSRCPRDCRGCRLLYMPHRRGRGSCVYIPSPPPQGEHGEELQLLFQAKSHSCG